MIKNNFDTLIEEMKQIRDKINIVLKIVEEENNIEKKERLSDILYTKIEDLELSVRTKNTLKNSGLKIVKNILNRNEKELLQIEGLGRKCLNELKDLLLEQYNIQIRRY